MDQKCSEGNIGTSEHLWESEKSDKAKTRAWVFTMWDEGEPPCYEEKHMKYLLFAPETCPDTGKFHYQGFVVWKSQKTRTACWKCLKGKTHPWVGWSKGDINQNLDYIRGPYEDSKGKTKPYNKEWKEFGDRPAQGKRVDLLAIRDQIADGARVEDLLLENPIMYHQYGRTLEKMEDIFLRSKWRTEMTTAIWIHGCAGAGKSHIAFEEYTNKSHYLWSDDNGWWCAYKQQEICILNEFRGEIPYNFLLQLIDKWPAFVPRRGREPIPFMSKHIIITSSLHPSKVYKNRMVEDSLKQLYRRCKVVHRYKWENPKASESDEE